jgi:hypothetical protein
MDWHHGRREFASLHQGITHHGASGSPHTWVICQGRPLLTSTRPVPRFRASMAPVIGFVKHILLVVSTLRCKAYRGVRRC